MSAAEFQQYWQARQKAKGSKYGAVPLPAEISPDGERYRSTLEYRYHQQLLVQQRAGEVVAIERERVYEFEVNGVFLCTYKLDFRVTYADGRVEHVDTKSQATLSALYKLKKGLMLALHGIELIEKFDHEVR